MHSIIEILGSCQAGLTDLVGLPARQLASFMDDVDEVWLSDTFLDQPDSVDRAR